MQMPTAQRVFTAASRCGSSTAMLHGSLAQLPTRSALVMPMPESMIVRVLLALSGMMWMYSSGLLSRTALLVRDSNLQHELDALGCKAQPKRWCCCCSWTSTPCWRGCKCVAERKLCC